MPPATPSITDAMRTLTDGSRLRIVLLLGQEELSVAELQEILAMGQSSISTHLGQLKRAGLVTDRRAGKNILYRLRTPEEWADLLALARRAAAEFPETAADRRALALILDKRRDRARAYFDELAGKFGRHYVPGRSWKGLAEMLLLLMDPMDIADLGAGEGTFSQLLARRARRVIAVDNSEKMVAYASDVARRNGVSNIKFRVGDLEAPPIEPGSIDLAFFSQSLHHAGNPARAVRAAWTLLRPGGRIVLLDLKKHGFEQARELYADVWLGFGEAELAGFLDEAGFGEISVAAVHKEEERPYFETLLAVGRRPL
ncbi:MAG: metalloregulator ArsR/SmtB family transcription factor [Acidobacteria bacterium]|nr:metalloregulator ArsR/SmtB family transcription factor [Acidobacteriota bacterium]